MKEHDIIIATHDIKLYTQGMSHGNKPLFDIIPKGTQGTIVHLYSHMKGIPDGAEVEFDNYNGPVTINIKADIKPL